MNTKIMRELYEGLLEGTITEDSALIDFHDTFYLMLDELDSLYKEIL